MSARLMPLIGDTPPKWKYSNAHTVLATGVGSFMSQPIGAR
ncbi:Uncharacterised protein [Mycobacteroides abscessus subsp. abscessus]|nr:Uncharacterised protein [Mycobacteroides abscessus subsp. abscessus]